ncbi:hypothetical protein BGW80DRAFT_1444762 [Lactifluus volemus]|nr:hypothetical protein BGW80DRAFT_1444762 [Lactifluus volemus]
MASTSAAAADSAPVALSSFSTMVGVVGQLKPWSQLDAEEPSAIFQVKHWGVPLPGSTPEHESFPLKSESLEGDQDCTILAWAYLSQCMLKGNKGPSSSLDNQGMVVELLQVL